MAYHFVLSVANQAEDCLIPIFVESKKVFATTCGFNRRRLRVPSKQAGKVSRTYDFLAALASRWPSKFFLVFESEASSACSTGSQRR